MNTIDPYPEKLMSEALSKYSTPYGQPNPETYAYLAGASAMNGSAGVWRKATLDKKDLPPVGYGEPRYFTHNWTDETTCEKDACTRNQIMDLIENGWEKVFWLDESVSSPSPLEAETADKKISNHEK